MESFSAGDQKALARAWKAREKWCRPKLKSGEQLSYVDGTLDLPRIALGRLMREQGAGSPPVSLYAPPELWE